MRQRIALFFIPRCHFDLRQHAFSCEVIKFTPRNRNWRVLAIGKFDVERHGAGIIGANLRGGKPSMPSARAGVRWRRMWVMMRRAVES